MGAPESTERHVLLVFTDCQPGQDTAFNDWYDHEHVPELLRWPGIVAAERFKINHAEDLPEGMGRYLVIYELEGNPDTIVDGLRSNPTRRIDSSKDWSKRHTWTFQAIAPRQTARE